MNLMGNKIIIRTDQGDDYAHSHDYFTLKFIYNMMTKQILMKFQSYLQSTLDIKYK